MVEAVAIGHACARWQDDCLDFGMVAEPLDLLDGALWVLDRNRDADEETLVAGSPFLERPVVEGSTQGSAIVGVWDERAP